MSDIKERAIEVAGAILGPLAQREVPLGARTTYRVGGAAALFVEIDDEAELPTVVDAVGASGADVLIVGKGSNMLVADRGFLGIVICLGEHFSSVVVADGAVEAGGTTPFPVLARRCAAVGATGLEWAVGIPGSVGGAVSMNAGGHGAETVDRLLDARVLRLGDGREVTLDPVALGLSYRHSDLGPSDLVLSARFSCEAGDRAEAEAEIGRIVAWRRANQPGGRNGGSVFTNPAGDSAGRLIEEAGLKGLTIGSATVSEKHANFIGVDESGSADDVYRLIEAVRDAVVDRVGVTLEVELRLVGFPS